MPKPTVLLEYSEDPLSIATPTYRDVTYPYLIDAAWWAGIENELDEPRAGGAVFRMKNLNRDWEPLLAGGPFTVDTDRRFRLFLNGTQEGEWFTSDFEIDYPGGTDYSLVTITCGDGQVLLGSDHLPALDPPDATSYEEVINHDEPAFYYRMGEPAGTKLVAHVRKVGRKGHRHKRRWKTLETSAELGGVSGPSGVYKGTPTLGEPGAIRGDPDKSVKFTSTGNERAMIQVDQSDLIDTNRLSISLWVKPTATGSKVCLAGPEQTGLGLPVFYLYAGPANPLNLILQWTDGSSGQAIGATNLSTDTWYHIGGSWDGQTIRVYLNGVLDGSGSYPGKVLRQGSAGQYLMFGGTTSGAGGPTSMAGSMKAPSSKPLLPPRVFSPTTSLEHNADSQSN